MVLSFQGATDKVFGNADGTMSVGQIAIKRQCPLAFGNSLYRPIGYRLEGAKV
jgi:hypothetical protein